MTADSPTPHPKAYDGKGSYIFVSYAHKDGAAVLPVLDYLVRRGYNVWYDEGITPGADWDRFLADKVAHCSCFLCFLSERSAASRECFKEMARAVESGVPILNVFLEPVLPPDSLREAMMRIQGIERWRLTADSDFYAKLLSHNLFDGCSEVEEFSIQDGRLVRYGGTASHVVVPDTVTHIGYDAFEGNDAVVSIDIPASVDRIGKFAFNNMANLQSISVSPKNGFFASIDGVLYNKARNYLLRYPQAKAGNHYAIPSGVKNVAMVSFAGVSDLISVDIPESVTMLGERAFESCRNLIDVSLAASITALRPYLFSRCSSLLGISLPDTLARIEDGAFAGCTSLADVAIPGGVRSLGEMAFAYCDDLAQVVIPEGVREVPAYCFHECPELTALGLKPVRRIRQYAFKNCTGLQEVTFSDELTAIDRAAFSGCSSLETLHLPDSLTTLGDYSFDRCTSLRTVRGGRGLARIGTGAFEGDTALESVEVPASLDAIGKNALPETARLVRL